MNLFELSSYIVKVIDIYVIANSVFVFMEVNRCYFNSLFMF